jgi:hypothetical protein
MKLFVGSKISITIARNKIGTGIYAASELRTA